MFFFRIFFYSCENFGFLASWSRGKRASPRRSALAFMDWPGSSSCTMHDDFSYFLSEKFHKHFSVRFCSSWCQVGIFSLKDWLKSIFGLVQKLLIRSSFTSLAFSSEKSYNLSNWHISAWNLRKYMYVYIFRPANMLMGVDGTAEEKFVHCCDFGLAREFVQLSTDDTGRSIYKLRPPRERAPFR